MLNAKSTSRFQTYIHVVFWEVLQNNKACAAKLIKELFLNNRSLRSVSTIASTEKLHYRDLLYDHLSLEAISGYLL